MMIHWKIVMARIDARDENCSGMVIVWWFERVCTAVVIGRRACCAEALLHIEAARGCRYCPSQVAGTMTHLVNTSVRAS